MITSEGIKINPEGIDAIVNWPVPKNIKDLQQFLGFVNYHREHLKNYSKLSSVVTDLMKKKEFRWEDKHTKYFVK